jgi:hypothetical protein
MINETCPGLEANFTHWAQAGAAAGPESPAPSGAAAGPGAPLVIPVGSFAPSAVRPAVVAQNATQGSPPQNNRAALAGPSGLRLDSAFLAALGAARKREGTSLG